MPAATSHSPEEALKQMQVAEGFEVILVASEPEIRQPLSITFDERGRMWVIQYLQYPTPAGLSPVTVDKFLRTKYDRLPEPPPHGPKGADRITICELSQWDGRAYKFKDFVSGLNLCSGMALGHGGVFVLQPPYLLFYPDKNHDDVPDSDPEVLLTGFGMEDAHAFANSLTWGPDGWLYGAQGSTVTAKIRNLEFQQGIWRYHPITKEFELFAEGGGNTWGLDFDEGGEILAGTNFEDKMLHQVQGAYYVKNFGKHGELHNSHAYGYFGHVPYTGYRGGHISIGGIVYQGAAFPPEYDGAYIFGNTLDHAVYWAKLQRQGSSFTASFAGTLLKTEDELFRPVDCELGPDGAVYIADWCDRRASHVDPLDTWDRSNGRIYKISAQIRRAGGTTGALAGGTPALLSHPFDLRKFSSEKLVGLLSNPNAWFARKARLLLAERRDPAVLPSLRKEILNTLNTRNPRLALQSLWALSASGGFDEQFGASLLGHENENIRAWAIRLLGDSRKVSTETATRLARLGRVDSSPIVRAQLACTAKRLPGNDALAIIAQLLRRDEDVAAPHLPLLLWWALEDKAITQRQRVLEIFASADIWRRSIVEKFIIERLARRYADESGEADFAACVQLLKAAPDAAAVKRVMQGMEQAMAGRTIAEPSPALKNWFANAWSANTNDPAYLRLGLRIADPRASGAARKILSDETSSDNVRISIIDVLGLTGNSDWVPPLLRLFAKAKTESLREAVLRALRNFPAIEIAEVVINAYPNLTKVMRAQARQALCSRMTWSRLLLDAVDAGQIEAKEVSLEEARQIAAFQDPKQSARIQKRWGKIQSSTPEEKMNSINRLKLVLKPSGVVGRDAKGNPAGGKKVFQTACGVCHKLFDEGNSIGPDLTGTDRKNSDYLLEQIVSPSAYIRPEYVSYNAEMKDERIITGLMADSTPATVTLLDRNNERHVLAREQIRELQSSEVSLMPEGLLEALTPEQLMDLFAYLQMEVEAPRTKHQAP